MGVTLFRFFKLLAFFFTSCFEDGSWRPQKLQNQEKYKKHKENATFCRASGLQLWPGRPSSRPQSQVQQVDFRAELKTRTNPWPQSQQCWICSGLHIRREVDLLRLVFHGHSHCNAGFLLVCKSALKSTCCTCKSQALSGFVLVCTSAVMSTCCP